MFRVSVVIPTYNYARYIKDAVNSILQQTYPSDQIEIIVIDDGSIDETKTVLQPFIERGEIQYHYQENKGKANATSKGIQKSSGRYIFNLDADDYFLPEKIASSVEVFERDSSIVHVASPAKLHFQETGETGSEKLPDDILEKPLDGNWLLKRFYNNNILFGGGSTYAAKSSALKTITIPNEVDMYIDEFLLLAILPLGSSYFFKQPLSAWRIHNANYSGNNVSENKQVLKTERLMRSSSAVLQYVLSNNYSNELKTIYRLQHATRGMAFKEDLGIKKTKDIFQYSSEVFLHIKPAINLLAKYNVLNRLIPTPMFKILKKLKGSF